MQEAVRMHTESHPLARLRSATAVYNCYGLVFASRRTWIDISEDVEGEVRNILADDRYSKLPSSAALQIGDVVLYKDHSDSLTHAAIVLNVPIAPREDIKVISQWGAGGEYIHNMTDVIATYGQPSEFWTDRRELP